jgi:hypothetical protein
MAESALAKKMKIKPGQRIAVLGAPAGFLAKLKPLPEGVGLTEKLQGKLDWIQVFVKNKAELDRIAPKAAQALKPEGSLWLTFPKGTSKVQTDLTRDKGWDSVAKLNLKWINLVSVDETWSAFSLRPYRPGEARQSFR